MLHSGKLFLATWTRIEHVFHIEMGIFQPAMLVSWGVSTCFNDPPLLPKSEAPPFRDLCSCLLKRENQANRGVMYLYLEPKIEVIGVLGNECTKWLFVKLDHFPRDRGEHKKSLKPSPSICMVPGTWWRKRVLMKEIQEKKRVLMQKKR